MTLSLIWFPGWCGSTKQATVRRWLLVCSSLAFLGVAAIVVKNRVEDGSTLLYRFNLWGAALRLIGKHPVFGVGFFNFGAAMATVEQGLGGIQAEFRQVENGVASHNTVLTILVEFGFTGFIIYSLAFIAIVQKARDNCLRRWGTSGPAWVIAFAIAYLVSAQFISCFEGTVNTIFFGYLGVLAGARHDAV
jgi:O-antigen ligase